jgi:ribosomal protein S18 acetylase RimI-like enzyme
MRRSETGMHASAPAIRLADPTDIPAVRDLLVETWHDTYDALIGREKVTEITDRWHSVENLARQLALPETSFLVAGQAGAIVGHAFADARRPPALFLTRLYVRPDRQRSGVGSRLIEATIARHPMAEVIRLEAKAGNASALAFYRRQGFVSVGEKVVEGLNHFEMEKRLARVGREGSR